MYPCSTSFFFFFFTNFRFSIIESALRNYNGNHQKVHQVKLFGLKYTFFFKLIKSLNEELIKLSALWWNREQEKEDAERQNPFIYPEAH